MHEASLVKSLLDQVETLRVQHGGTGVNEICIEIGPLSGVEPLLVRSAFEQLSPGFGLDGTRLSIDEVPLIARCPVCDVVEVSLPRIACPVCGSPEVRIISGDTVRLKSITIQQELSTGASA
jgi:hydrogenase nickel incorporation protein HypA/HybF